jgi:hypothetical protein
VHKRRSSPRLRWFGAVVLVFPVAASAWLVAAPSHAAAAPDRLLMVTLHGDATAKRTWPVETREAGSWTVRWLVRESQLTVGRQFFSTSAIVTGTASAHASSVSCRGTLAARLLRFTLIVQHKTSTEVGFITAPSPFATAVSSACQQGVSASTWPLRTSLQRRDWWLFNHPGFGFVLPRYTPGPRGGNSEGWMLHTASTG